MAGRKHCKDKISNPRSPNLIGAIWAIDTIRMKLWKPVEPLITINIYIFSHVLCSYLTMLEYPIWNLKNFNLYFHIIRLFNLQCIYICTYIFTTSPSFISTSASLANGEKWQTQLLTDIQVGNATPKNI